MPAGRPTKYDPDYCRQCVEAGQDGYSLTAFAGMIGTSRSTISKWADEHPEFSEAVHEAKAARAIWWEDRLRGVAMNGGGGGQGTVAIFGVRNVAPDDWTDKKEIDHRSGDQSMSPTRIEITAPDHTDSDT